MPATYQRPVSGLLRAGLLVDRAPAARFAEASGGRVFDVASSYREDKGRLPSKLYNGASNGGGEGGGRAGGGREGGGSGASPGGGEGSGGGDGFFARAKGTLLASIRGSGEEEEAEGGLGGADEESLADIRAMDGVR